MVREQKSPSSLRQLMLSVSATRQNYQPPISVAVCSLICINMSNL